MNDDIKKREEIIYNEIIKLKKGTRSDRDIAFECIGILGNESTTEPFLNRLNIVEKKIINYYKDNNKI